MAREFFLVMGKVYGTGFRKDFEPHIAGEAFNALIADSGVPVLFNERLDPTRDVTRSSKRIASIQTETGCGFAGKMFVDASYEGNLMAKAGVSYVVGRESNTQYGETLNGFQLATPVTLEQLSDLGSDERRMVSNYVMTEWIAP